MLKLNSLRCNVKVKKLGIKRQKYYTSVTQWNEFCGTEFAFRQQNFNSKIYVFRDVTHCRLVRNYRRDVLGLFVHEDKDKIILRNVGYHLPAQKSN